MFARLARSSFPVWKQRFVLARTLAVAPVFANRIAQWNKLCPLPPSRSAYLLLLIEIEGSVSNVTTGDRSAQSPFSDRKLHPAFCFTRRGESLSAMLRKQPTRRHRLVAGKIRLRALHQQSYEGKRDVFEKSRDSRFLQDVLALLLPHHGLRAGAILRGQNQADPRSERQWRSLLLLLRSRPNSSP